MKTGFKYCYYALRLLNKVQSSALETNKLVDIELIKKAIFYAKKYHGIQKRDSGEPFYSHPLEVAYMLTEFTVRTDLIVTAILHDTIEDTELTQGIIAKNFGKLIAEQVEDLTRIKNGRKLSSKELLDLLWKQKKFDILLIKLLDRVHNIQTINAKSPEKATKILKETLDNFLWMAAYLEVVDIESKFRKICCDYLRPEPSLKKSNSEEQSVLENLISNSNFF